MTGTAARFDAATDRVSYVPGPGNPPDAFTITMWVYLVVDSGSDTSLYRRYTSGGTARGQIGTDVGSGTALAWFPPGLLFNHSMVVGQWTRLAVTVSGATAVTYAGQGAAGTLTTNTGSAGTVAGANQVTLAAISVGNGGQPANVRLAHVRTFAGLTQAQIEAEWASATPVNTGGLWSAWPLSADLLDTSGNARHLAAGSTAVTFTEDGPPIGSAPVFSGTISLAATADLAVTGNRATAGTLALAAVADVPAAGSRASSGTAGLIASAGLSGAGARASGGVAGLSADGVLAVAGSSVRAGTLALVATSGFSTSATPEVQTLAVVRCGRSPRAVWDIDEAATVWSSGRAPQAAWRIA